MTSQNKNNTSRNRTSNQPGDANEKTSGVSRRGFASMDPKRRQEIAAKGGRASHGGRSS